MYADHVLSEPCVMCLILPILNQSNVHSPKTLITQISFALSMNPLATLFFAWTTLRRFFLVAVFEERYQLASDIHRRFRWN